MRVLSIVMLVLWVCSAAAAEDALAQEDTATLWAACAPAGTLRWCGTARLLAELGIRPGSDFTTARPNAI